MRKKKETTEFEDLMERIDGAIRCSCGNLEHDLMVLVLSPADRALFECNACLVSGDPRGETYRGIRIVSTTAVKFL